MHRIVSGITSLEAHLLAVSTTPAIYRPLACPHCGSSLLWRHGCYYRKADRSHHPGPSRNPVPILRYCCPGCSRTCSRLPLCIAPRRWYDWAVQQQVLRFLLNGYALHSCSRCTFLDRRTVRRWWDWLNVRSETFMFFLRSRFPESGRSVDQPSFWRLVLNDMSLAQVMAWLDLEIDVPT